jgi:hypothetical protein
MKTDSLSSDAVSTEDAARAGLLALIGEGPERCTRCRAPFTHGTTIFAGVAETGEVAIVGECCLEEMHEIYGIGVTDTRFPARLDA